MKKHLIFALAGVVVGLMLFADADAQMMQGPKQGQGMGDAMMGQGMNCGMLEQGRHGAFGFYLNHADELDLTQAQIKQLRDMKFEFEKANIQGKATIHVAQIELRQLKMADNVVAKKVEAKIRKIQDKKADLEIATFRAQTEAKNVLTPEQKAKLETMTCPLRGSMHGRGTMQKGMMMRRGSMMQQEEEK